jgi:hypothetical protein
VFELFEQAQASVLTIVESGFDCIPLHRRVEAFNANAGGWDHQLKLVSKYAQMNLTRS